MVNKLISISEELKCRLDTIKIHHRETYGDLIERLIEMGSYHDK